MQPVVTAQLRRRRLRLFIHVFLAQRGVSGGDQRQPQRQHHQAQHSSAPMQLCNQLAPPRAGSPIVAADAETLSMRPGADSMTATLAAPTPPPGPQMPPPAPLPILPDDGGFACSTHNCALPMQGCSAAVQCMQSASLENLGTAHTPLQWLL